jgi:hypothetical protein
MQNTQEKAVTKKQEKPQVLEASNFVKQNENEKQEGKKLLNYIKENNVNKLCLDIELDIETLKAFYEWIKLNECTLTHLILRRLKFSDHGFHMTSLGEAMCENKSLRRLSLEYVDVNEGELKEHKFFKFLECNNTLTKIDFVSLNMYESLDHFTKCMLNNSSVVEINLHESEMKSYGALCLSKILKSRNNFKKLDIGLCEIEDNDMTVIIEGLKNNPGMTKINIDSDTLYTRFEESSMKYFSNCLEFLKNLKSLSVGRNRFGKTNFQNFCGKLQYLHNLEKLFLCGCHIDDKDCRYLSESLKSCNKLRKLDISDNGINNEFGDLNNLIDSCPTLTDIEIDFNPLSIEGVEKLVSNLETNKTLKSISVNDDNFDRDSTKTLADIISSNNCLKTIICYGHFFKNKVVKKIFTSLKNNNTLKKFTFYKIYNTKGSPELSECLIESVISNKSLIKVTVHDKELNNRLQSIMKERSTKNKQPQSDQSSDVELPPLKKIKN